MYKILLSVLTHTCQSGICLHNFIRSLQSGTENLSEDVVPERNEKRILFSKNTYTVNVN